MRAELGMTLMLISHDLGLARSCADEVDRDVRGPDRGAGSDAAAVHASPDAVHRGPVRGDPAAGAAGALAAAGDRRQAARPFRAAGWLLVRPALPPRRGRLPHDRPAARRTRARPPLGVLASLRKRRSTDGHSAAGGPRPGPGVRSPGLWRVKGGVVHAVSGVSFNVWPGETLGIVGETGSRESTLARAVIKRRGPRREPPPSAAPTWPRCAAAGRRGPGGTCRWCSRTRSARWTRSGGSVTWLRSRSSPTGPGDRAARRRRVDEVLELVGLDPAGHGGRCAPASCPAGRPSGWPSPALAPSNPALIICDEAVSSLDVLIQAQVLNLFERLRAELRPVLPVHRARPGPGQAGQRPGGGDVPGQAVRDRAGGGGLPPAAAPLHPRAARLGARRRGARGAQDHPRRAALPGPPAERVPVPDPLPARRAALRGRGTGPA